MAGLTLEQTPPASRIEPAVFSSAMPWSVLHLRSRTEKVVERKIQLAGYDSFESYLPLWTQSKRYQRRLVTNHLPLFPGYLFVRGDQGAAWEFANRTREVVSCLPVNDQGRFHETMMSVHRVSEESGDSLRPETKLPEGAAVEIVSGPLAGMRGRVVSKLKSMRFVLSVDLLQQGVSVEVDDSMIEEL